MKRILSIVLAITMVLAMLNTVALAADDSTLTVSANTQEVKPGETAIITLTITNNPGFGWLSISPICDEGLDWKAQNGDLSLDIDKGAKNINWSSDEDCAELGTLATLSITVSEDVTPGIYEIKFRVNECYDENFDDVTVTFASAMIIVTCAHANTTDVPAEPVDCDNGGYTAGVYCNDCQTYISGREPVPATGNHTDANGMWEVNVDAHFHTCECGHIFDTAAHSGGNATCKEKAKCATCGAEYGQLNPANHAGGTTVINAVEPNHKTQQNGYSGDTKCLGCGEIIAYGQVVKADDHVPANMWSNDATHHWKECNVVGCGVVINGSKAPHSSEKAENKATCQKQAVCDVCGVSYGAVAEHDFMAEIKSAQTQKSAGNCRDNAVYYYSCTVCGLVEHNDNHTFQGEKVAADHVGGTTLVNASAADHKTQQNGYTGDTKCLGCGQITAYGQAIVPVPHSASAQWQTDGTSHWKVCTVVGCGMVMEGSKADHTSTGANVATCKQNATCDVCNTAYGGKNASNHTGGTTVINAVEPNHKVSYWLLAIS